MVMTDTMSIPVSSRGFLLKHKEAWSAEYGVKVWFPKNERFGSFQTMHLEGLSGNLRAVKSLAQGVIDEANDEYLAYKERNARRKRENPRVKLLIAPCAQKTAKKVRGFGALDELGDGDPCLVEKKVEVEKPKEMNLQGAWVNGAPDVSGSWGDDGVLGDWGDE